MRMPPYQVAAHLLERVLSRLGSEMPNWLWTVLQEDRILTQDEYRRRCAPELYRLLSKLQHSTLVSLMDIKGLSLWYDLYSCYEDVDCMELTGRMERPAELLRQECAARFGFKIELPIGRFARANALTHLKWMLQGFLASATVEPVEGKIQQEEANRMVVCLLRDMRHKLSLKERDELFSDLVNLEDID